MSKPQVKIDGIPKSQEWIKAAAIFSTITSFKDVQEIAYLHKKIGEFLHSRIDREQGSRAVAADP